MPYIGLRLRRRPILSMEAYYFSIIVSGSANKWLIRAEKEFVTFYRQQLHPNWISPFQQINSSVFSMMLQGACRKNCKDYCEDFRSTKRFQQQLFLWGIINLFLLLILDVDECRVKNGGCSQLCENSVGSFRCRCKNGYDLSPDKTSCTGKDLIRLITVITITIMIQPCRLVLVYSKRF